MQNGQDKSFNYLVVDDSEFARKTLIKVREVEVGLVESVGLAEDLESVVVTARLEKEAEKVEGLCSWPQS